MKTIKIIKPIDGYAVGDTPELVGSKVRELIASGHAERIGDDAKLVGKKTKAKA